MEKVLILSLGRTGSLPIYGEEIAKKIKNQSFDILISKNRLIKNKIPNSIEIKTYTNKITFLLNTFFYLPIVLLLLSPKIIKKYNTLYLPYQHLWDFPFIFLFKILNRKIVFTIHDGVLHAGERNIVSQKMTNYRIKKASEIIYLTSYVKGLVENELGYLKKHHIVPHPIIENKFFKKNTKIRNTKNLLFFGRIDKYKGVEMLIDAAQLSSKSFDKLIIAGKSQYYINFVDTNQISLIDKYLSEKEIGELLSWADVLVLPYKEASQSGVITLGIFCELPMICTNVGGFTEQLEDDECIWCNPNTESISKAIDTVFNDKTRYYSIKNKLKLKKQSLTWEKIASKIEEIIFKE
ncbi:glycosyltransferase family 4 protein [Polaribacter cellanae]|uniref:Glycosyltransferase family 4 protein n=1 Tax=Polaribacter cellanae TaxID=2818493 RepID=A0A975H5L0_9FLAO|nr:glycosyltransferase family 4 protein [Polaribacter cellanae]QTE21497.1 glycosyltransferase family 4 protein [Polaribacter cellanae]